MRKKQFRKGSAPSGTRGRSGGVLDTPHNPPKVPNGMTLSHQDQTYAAPLLMVPGYGNSEPTHWQGLWHARYAGSRWTEQRDWENPLCREWVDTLERAVAECPAAPLLVGHSLGCTTIAAWAAQSHRRVLGALLVAPPDPAAPQFPSAIRGYSTEVERPLPFPTWVAASTNDPYASWERSLAMAKAWGAELVSFGPQGHLNLEAGLGEWPAGEALLARILRHVGA